MKPAERLLTRLAKPVTGQEIIAKRTMQSKTFDLGGGRKRLITGPTPLHYQLGDQWDEIDLTLRDDGDFWLMDKAPYILRIAKRGATVQFEDRATGAKHELAYPSIAGAVELDGVRGIWQAGTDRHAYLIIRPSKIVAETVLESDRADTLHDWRVDGKEPEQVRARDAKGNAAEVQGRQFMGRVSRQVDKKTRRREWQAGPDCPVRMV